MAAQSVSQVSFVPQSTAVRRKNHRSAKVLLIKVTKRPESASKQQQQQCDLPFLFPLGRWREILPRSLVIGRMLVIDLGVNVCASLSTSSHHSTPQLSPVILSPSCEFCRHPLPEESRGVCSGVCRASPRQNPPVGRAGCCRSTKDAVNSAAGATS